MIAALANALVPIFVGLLLGFWGGRQGWMDRNNVRNLIALVMNVAIPCALFSIIMRSSRAVLKEQAVAALAITLTFGVLYVGCFIWARRRWQMNVPDTAVLALTVGFPNCAAIALSLLSDIFGNKAAVPAAISLAVGSITVSPITLALLELSKGNENPTVSASQLLRGVLHSFRKPVVLAPILALLCVCVGIHLPRYISTTLNTLGDAADGSALLLTGLVISAQSFRFSGPVVLTTLAKAFVQPLIAIGFCLLFRLTQEQIREIALIGTIPGGFFGLVFGKSFNATPESASSSLVASYILSVVSLPLWIFALSRFV
jgi:predicted permease